MSRKICLIGMMIVLLSSSVYPTLYFSHRFDRDITIVCPDCDYWLSCETDSMHPTFNCNDTLVGVEPRTRKDIKVGDIIWFHGTKEQLNQYENKEVKYIVHRIKRIDHKGCYITQGDNNKIEDTYTPCFYDIKLVIKVVIYN